MRRAIITAGVLGAGLMLPGQASAFSFFQSPSQNIGCVMTKQNVRCDIRQRSFDPPPKPRSCDFDWGNAVGVGKNGKGRFLCVSDTTLGAGDELAYGDSIRRGRFRCKSLQSGMRCVNKRNGHGFKLSRQRARLF
jgi:hypothetical protein